MKYKSKQDLVKETNFRTLGLCEYIHELKEQGLTDTQVQGKMVIDNVVKSPRSVQRNFSTYKKLSKEIGWIK